SARWYRCPECGTSLQRDHNAARPESGLGRAFGEGPGVLASENRASVAPEPRRGVNYKAQLLGIVVILTEEAFTSKYSFPETQPPIHQVQYFGTRVKRGVFVTATGRRINADVNAAYNMIVKVVTNAFGDGSGGVVVHPVRLRLANQQLATKGAR